MATSATQKHYLGIDIGSVSYSYVLMDQKRQIIQSDYRIHNGNIFNLLKEQLSKIDFPHVQQIVYNHKAADFFNQGISVNEQVAIIEGVRFQVQDVGSVFSIGGETFGLVLFDENKQYQKFIANSSCAAGTGAFLDQQAERLGLADSAEISQLAETFSGEPPKIATRCAVFAKTDLIHCQQQGYTIEAISDGLCKGLAQNIADTLVKGITLRKPVIVVGGVSKNHKVMHYLSEIIGSPVVIPENSVLTGAIGCALIAQSKSEESTPPTSFSIDALLKSQTQNKQYFFPPLSSELSVFPDFSDHTNYISNNVEVDIYDLPIKKGRIPVYMGFDIGSTSTKAILMDAKLEEQHILLGLYTRTMGQPIKATQELLRVLREIEKKYKIHFKFLGVGTTGSGRKFIQKVIRADMAIDEITAHARAAYSLNPEVDTIIEIGGQDAKFTVIKNGQVTFSVMNYVCAAGTGSFIEEQAKRLNVSLNEYSQQAIGAPSPLTSDRCTVFMERDLNHFLSQGYSKSELLAAVLHSVRDNYLSKVAHLNKIGNVLCFQGATAKNNALVMAFEQKLKKPIFVSKYCHLTGALGVCLLLQEQRQLKSEFRGIDFYKKKPIVSNEVCDGCKNHCKLNKIKIGDETIVWGYLCGRDEMDSQPKSLNISGFDLLSSRRKILNPGVIVNEITSEDTQKPFLDELKALEFDFSFDKIKQSFGLNLLNLRHKLFATNQDEILPGKEKNEIKIGIPNTLYLQEFIPFWKFFFNNLGYSVIVSSPKPDLLKKGKEISGAEFCTPISYWHGHVHDLIDRVDYIFLPHMFQGGDTDDPKFYCYYSNYAIALLQNNKSLVLKNKNISPIIDFSKPAIYNIQEIYENLPHELKFIQTPNEIKEAFNQAWRWFSDRKKQLIELFLQKGKNLNEISVVLLGRPYLIMDPVMNKNIPNKFNELGIKTFFQDMLPKSELELDKSTREFIKWNHWKYGANILSATEYIVQNPGLYPVFLTAFKCSPDSFVINYFKEIMDTYQKPYLILQLDEHGSDVGYETRIESAVRSFRNHFKQKKPVVHSKFRHNIQSAPDVHGTILVPNYDSLSCSLICAAFEHAGYRAKLIEETETTVISSLRLNDGQCLPISAITQAAIETIQKHNLEPESTSIFLNAITRTACNLPQYPLMMKNLLEQRGDGFEKVQIFATEFEMRSCSIEVIYDVYCSYLLGGLLRKLACKIRPYEIIPGQTDRVIEEARQKLYHCIAKGQSKETKFKEIVASLSQIPVSELFASRPKVGIIGDLYVRDNDVFNQQLNYELESYGAEVVTTPFTYILRMLAIKHSLLLKEDGRYFTLLRDKLLLDVLEKFEKRFFRISNEILKESFPVFDESVYAPLEKYNLSLKHGGETAQNISKIFSLLKHYPDLALLIHVNPIFCCPGLVSESIFETLEKDIGIPIVSIIYDGTTANKNEILAPYLHYITKGIKDKTTCLANSAIGL